MEDTKKIIKRFCDVCGEPVDGSGFIVARDSSGEIIYEDKVIGDYCPEHADALLLAALRNGGLAERYDRFETDAEKEAQKAVERALIADEYVSSVQRYQQLEQAARKMWFRLKDSADSCNAVADSTVEIFLDQLTELGVSVDD